MYDSRITKKRKLAKFKKFKTRENCDHFRSISSIDEDLVVTEIWYVIDDPCINGGTGHAIIYAKANNGCYYFFDLNGINGENGLRARVHGMGAPIVDGFHGEKKYTQVAHFVVENPNIPVHHYAAYAHNIWNDGGQIFNVTGRKLDGTGMNCYLFADRFYNLLTSLIYDQQIPEVNAFDQYKNFCGHKKMK